MKPRGGYVLLYSMQLLHILTLTLCVGLAYCKFLALKLRSLFQ